jgi:hypothetical protein
MIDSNRSQDRWELFLAYTFRQPHCDSSMRLHRTVPCLRLTALGLPVHAHVLGVLNEQLSAHMLQNIIGCYPRLSHLLEVAARWQHGLS